jgi:hypothetical protein
MALSAVYHQIHYTRWPVGSSYMQRDPKLAHCLACAAQLLACACLCLLVPRNIGLDLVIARVKKGRQTDRQTEGQTQRENEALGCVLLTGRGHGDKGQPSCFAPPRLMSSQPGGQSRPDHILLSPALYGLDYSAGVSNRVTNTHHVPNLTLSLPVPHGQSCHSSSLFCCLSVPALGAVLGSG